MTEKMSLFPLRTNRSQRALPLLFCTSNGQCRAAQVMTRPQYHKLWFCDRDLILWVFIAIFIAAVCACIVFVRRHLKDRWVLLN